MASLQRFDIHGFLSDGPVVVTVGFWVLSIDSINVVDMVSIHVIIHSLLSGFLSLPEETLR